MMLATRQSCIIACRKRRGFALVVTLSLMVLLTVVAVGLLSLSAVSLRASSRGEAMSAARANARMALMLALGTLQKELGPDQRISAPGGQQLGEEDKSSGGRWIGVYDAWPVGKETRPSPAFRRWLDQNMRYPMDAAMRGEDGRVRVLITANPDGTVRGVRMVMPSTSPSLNSGTTRPFNGARLPAFPPGADPNGVTIELTVDYVLIRPGR